MYDLGIIEHYIYTCSYFGDYSGLLSGGHHFRPVLFIYRKEPFILTAAAFGIYLIFKYRRLFLGGILFILCLFLFYLVTVKVIPKFGGMSYLSSWAFGYLGKTPLKMCIYILSHPWAILKLIFTNPLKIIYLIALFAPFFFLCILSPLELIPALPIIAISLLSQEIGHYTISNHHHAAIIAPVFVAFIYALPKVYNFCSKFKLSKQTLNTFLLAIALFFHIIFSCSPLSKVFWVKKLGYSWPFYKNAYIPTKRDIKIWQALKTYIPSDPKLKISYQNFLNCGYLSQRKKIFLYPSGIFKADYIILDLKRPYFIKGYEPAISLINFLGEKCTKVIKDALARDSRLIKTHWNVFNKINRTWIKIYAYDGFFIFKKPHSLNDHANTSRCIASPVILGSDKVFYAYCH